MKTFPGVLLLMHKIGEPVVLMFCQPSLENHKSPEVLFSLNYTVWSNCPFKARSVSKFSPLCSCHKLVSFRNYF